MNHPSSPPATVAILQLGRLGDMILTTPLFRAVKECWPGAALTVIALEHSALIAQHHPSVDAVVSVPFGILQLPTLARRLHRKSFDLYIDPKDHRSSTSRVVAEFIRAKHRVGCRANGGRETFDQTFEPPDQPLHYVDRMLRPLQLLHPERSFARRPLLGVPTESLRVADGQMLPGEHGAIAINISAGSTSRHWGLEHWEELIDEVSKKYSVAVISSPEDRHHADAICSTSRQARPVTTNTILDAAAIVARSRAVVSPDTSIVHIASAFNRPVVGLYPPNHGNLATFGPLSDRQAVLMPAPEAELSTIPFRQVVEGLGKVMAERQ
ncbi:MAG: glycosyltransferase family 9 protein [Candidatus Kapabacteria bacterium]|nr:glycosyltransferase family 9 protein [Candidatus Kapabacteria bacterium]